MAANLLFSCSNLQCCNSFKKELYEKPDSFLVRSHSFTNISNVTIQIAADAQQNREGHFFPLIQFRPCSGCKVKLLPEGGLLYVSFYQEHPKFFVADSHDTHPFTHPLIMTSILLYTKTSLNAIISCTSSQKRCKFLMVLIFKKGKAVTHENCLSFSLYSR